MWTIFKKELKGYFLSPIGYIVVGILLLVCTIFFYLTTVQYGSVELGALYFYAVLYGFMIVIPLLTMRMFSEERKNGTEQLILTSPVSMVGVVLGKFFAAMGVIAVTLIVSFMYFGIMSYFGSPNIFVLLVAMLGFLLVAGAAISVGMFASSITENQIISGIITIAFLIISLFIGNIHEIFSSVALIDFYLPFARGIISLESGILLILFAVLFISLTIIVLKRRKLVR